MQKNSLKSEYFLMYILAVEFITCIMVLLNIPIARQVIGFLYLTFIPGIVLVRMLKLEKSDMTETILFSVGLSIAFLMLTGLLINELFPLIGVLKPLSLVPLAITINIAVLLMCFLSFLRNRQDLHIPVVKFSKISHLIIPYFLLPFLSVTGAMLVNASQNNILLLLMMITISVLILTSTLLSPQKLSPYYPLALISTAVALLLHKSLISNYIHGFDINLDLYFFNLTKNSSYWNSNLFANRFYAIAYNKSNAMLSTTVLPTIYSVVLNVEGTWILKIIYPLVYSFVPLALYQLYRMQKWGKKTALVSTFFFMANYVFLQPTSNAKQMIAELFYVLLFLVLSTTNMNPLSKKVCFVLFSFALVTSHYGTSYIFLFLIFFTWLSKFFIKKTTRKITAMLAALFSVIAFSWYIYVSASGPFQNIVNVADNLFRNFITDFFSPQSRSEAVLKGIGIAGTPTFYHIIGRIFHYATEFFILIGFVTLVVKRKKIKVNQEYLVTLSLNMLLLLACIAIPSFAGALHMGRFYNITLLFLAPLCILGGKTFFKNLLKLKKEIFNLTLVSLVLVPFFLFQTGFIYEITGDSMPSSFSLSNYRMGEEAYNSMGLIHENEVFGAKWLSKYADTEQTITYCDSVSAGHVLISYGMVYSDNIKVLSNTTNFENGSYIYLRQYNVINGRIIGISEQESNHFNTTELHIPSNNNKIYSNGGCEIYKKPGNQ